jgi:hypothetical protein
MLLTQTHVFGGIDNLSRLPRAYIVERLCATNGRSWSLCARQNYAKFGRPRRGVARLIFQAFEEPAVRYLCLVAYYAWVAMQSFA